MAVGKEPVDFVASPDQSNQSNRAFDRPTQQPTGHQLGLTEMLL
ncbi:hypothetical protein CGRA01v4_10200 [Colletotrichum graminicola]|nr:hypothetical protein CGRA01v4_10200 [Colletotrichum graminicola]